MEILYNCKYNYWKKLKTLWQKEKLIVLSQCFQKSSAADASKCVYRWERVKKEYFHLKRFFMFSKLSATDLLYVIKC